MRPTTVGSWSLRDVRSGSSYQRGDAEGRWWKSSLCDVACDWNSGRQRQDPMPVRVYGKRVVSTWLQLPLRSSTLRTLLRWTYQLSSPTWLRLSQGMTFLSAYLFAALLYTYSGLIVTGSSSADEKANVTFFTTRYTYYKVQSTRINSATGRRS